MGDGKNKKSHGFFFFILVSAHFVKFRELVISRFFVRFLNVDFVKSMLSKVCECSFHDNCEHSFCFKGDFFLFIISYLVSMLLGIGCSMSTIACHHLLFLNITYHCCLSLTTIIACYHKVLLFEVFC
jgi:hypothetical protein